MMIIYRVVEGLSGEEVFIREHKVRETQKTWRQYDGRHERVINKRDARYGTSKNEVLKAYISRKQAEVDSALSKIDRAVKRIRAATKLLEEMNEGLS